MSKLGVKYTKPHSNPTCFTQGMKKYPVFLRFNRLLVSILSQEESENESISFITAA